MGEAQVNRNQQMAQTTLAQGKKGGGDAPGKSGGSNIATGGNYQGGGDNNRGYGRGNWGRGNAHGMGNRGPTGQMRNRPGGMGGRGIMGNGANGFGQGIGAAPPLLHPQTMMGQGFDPAFGGPMGRMGSYGGFPGAPAPHFSGILSSFPPVGGVGLPGVAPHVNPAFFGRGMPMGGMGMMPPTGVEGPNMGMWSDPNMTGWASEEQAGRARESSYGEEAASDHQYGEVSHDRGPWTNAVKEKIEAQKETGLGLLREGIEMIESPSMRGTCLGRKIQVMIMNGLREGIVMIEMLVAIGKGPEIVTVKGPVIEIVTGTGNVTGTGTGNVIGTDIGMRDMGITIGIGIVNQNMMSGKGDGHQGCIASHGFLKRKINAQDQGMLNMERGGV